MKILAIDPGTTQSAWLTYDTERGHPIKFGIEPNDVVLSLLRAKAFLVDHLAIEMMASYGMSVGAEVFATCVWIGRFIEAAQLPYTQIFRKECAVHLCHNARAKDPNIRQALIDRYGAPGTKRNPGILYGISKDVWAALAVAVTFTDTKMENHHVHNERTTCTNSETVA
jgi:hypothetical protein